MTFNILNKLPGNNFMKTKIPYLAKKSIKNIKPRTENRHSKYSGIL